MILLVKMFNLNSEQNEGNVRADVRVDGMLLLVAEDMGEGPDDIRVGHELVGAEEVVEEVDFFGKLRNQENRIGRVSHEDGGGQQESCFDFVIVFWQL